MKRYERHADAIAQLEIVTRAQPDLPPPWLTLGALHVELRQPQAAEAALQRFVQLTQASPTAAGSGGDGDDGAAAEALTQAWLLLAQAAEQRGDLAAAESWLARIDDPQRALEVQTRRALLLARQGQLQAARELVRATPERNPADARAKLLAEVQLLREVKQWAEAYALLASANQRFENDPDLLYEQAMIAEKLDRLDTMETLPRGRGQPAGALPRLAVGALGQRPLGLGLQQQFLAEPGHHRGGVRGVELDQRRQRAHRRGTVMEIAVQTVLELVQQHLELGRADALGVDRHRIDQHRTGHDQCLRSVATFTQAIADHSLVETTGSQLCHA